MRKEKVRVQVQKKREPIEGMGYIPKDLKDKLKRAKGAKGLLQDLESEVRAFVASWEARENQEDGRGPPSEDDSEDEEIVFVGRQGSMHDRPSSSGSDEFLEPEKMIFDALEDALHWGHPFVV